MLGVQISSHTWFGVMPSIPGLFWRKITRAARCGAPSEECIFWQPCVALCFPTQIYSRFSLLNPWGFPHLQPAILVMWTFAHAFHTWQILGAKKKKSGSRLTWLLSLISDCVKVCLALKALLKYCLHDRTFPDPPYAKECAPAP